MQEAFKKVEKDAFRFAGENEKLKKTIESMQEELDNLRKDASVMRSILDRAAVVSQAPAEAPKAMPAAPVKKEEPAQQLSAFDEIPVQQPTAPVTPSVVNDQPAEEAVAASASVEETPAPKKTQKSTNKNRVGTMFDLLTFSDV